MVEDSDDDGRQGLDLTLLEMRSSTLTAIDDAIRRLDAGRYGCCPECDRTIAERRLRALPFTVRCASAKKSTDSLDGRGHTWSAGQESQRSSNDWKAHDY
jgi:RNA polymerase-binding transcription factor DksA